MTNDKDIQKIFDVFCRKVLTNKLKDYHRSEVRRRKYETTLGETLSQLNVSYEWDEYFVREIRMGEYGLEIQDDDLWEALLALPETEQKIILLHALDFSDYKISDRINVPRRTVAEKRKRALKRLKEELERRHGFEKSK
ncbi:MAG: sigma-70 family RNA polymerase sigma factor [Firmicutes bacterium]|nr:sigma-70 family RNA polymerase sigma factor [Bacillota bacterium]